MESPPKRVTRARAAAKDKAPATGSIKVATASARAKTTKTMAPPSDLAALAPVTRRRTRAATEESEGQQPQEDTQQTDEPEPEKKTQRTTRGRAVRGKAAQAPVEELVMETVKEYAPVTRTSRRAAASSNEGATEPATRTRRAAAKKTVDETTADEPAEESTSISESAHTTRSRRTAASSEPEPAPAPAATRARGRVRKVEVAAEEPAPAAEPPKRVGRGRSTTTTAADKADVTKKSVKFDGAEPDKENIVHAAPKARRAISATKEPEPATGLRAKPVRRGAVKPAASAPAKAPSGHATVKTLVEEPSVTAKSLEIAKSPLLPKKIAKVATAPAAPKDESDDELAMTEKTPMRPLETPLKSPENMMSTAKKLDFTTSVMANRAGLGGNANLGTSIMGSPARRIPQSPWKGAIKESAKKAGPVLGESLLKTPKKLGDSFANSPFKNSMAPPTANKQSALKQSLMQSPARRPPSPVKISRNGSPTRTGPPVKSLGSARRPPSSVEVSRNGSPTRETPPVLHFGATPRASLFRSKIATPETAVRTGNALPSNTRQVATEGKPPSDITATPSINDIQPFTGRLSSVLPRHADPVMSGQIGTPISASATDKVEMQVGEPAEASIADIGDNVAGMVDDNDEPAPAELTIGEDITQGDIEAAMTAINEATGNTPVKSPSGFLGGAFNLRPEDENPFTESDSEDELATASPIYTVKMNSEDFAQLSTPRKKLDFPGKTPTGLGFTPLAGQLNKWHAPTPKKDSSELSLEDILAAEAAQEDAAAEENTSEKQVQESVQTPANGPEQEAPTPCAIIERPGASPRVASSFFDDEMMIRDEMYGENGEMEEDVTLDALDFAPEDIDDMDLALVAEADELSMIEELDELDDYFNSLPDEDDDGNKTVQGEAESAQMEGDQQQEDNDVKETKEGIQDATSTDIVNFAEDSVVSAFNRPMDSAVSEASQEYGDENVAPAEEPLYPVLPEQAAGEPAQSQDEITSNPSPAVAREQTPKPRTPLAPQSVRRSSRPFTPSGKITEQRTVHTVSKVPLKPAAAKSPVKFSPRKMPATVARGPSQIPRASGSPSGMSSNRRAVSTPAPTKSMGSSSGWSNNATPAKTPIRPAAAGILRGAIVFVDVHTSEGADASAVFVDLLTQMGARCLKTWGWNPSISPLSSLTSFPPNGDAPLATQDEAELDSKKIGITHVVFKDGSKRTMEKVRDTKGVVQCVGVGWVLDCEKEARWLDEAEYAIDVTHVPRGGARRRKSMEPRALANMNGTLISPSNEPQTEKVQRMGRRDSTQWMRTTSSEGEPTPRARKVDHDGDIDMDDYFFAELSPIPQTPTPANIEEYVERCLDSDATPYAAAPTPFGMTPYNNTPYGRQPDETPVPVMARQETKAKILMQTMPVKRNDGPSHNSTGQGQDSAALMQRLMLARRKSLQWAPKIGSPLARGNNYNN